MEQCFKCGLGDDKALLYDVITHEGIQKVCRKCSHKEDSPLVKNQDSLELKEFERKQDIYERISRVSGIDNKKKLNQSNLVIENQESSLRDLVEKNVNIGLSKEAKHRDDLVENFHWIIKRTRRIRHFTAKQLAEEIGEVEKTIALAEEGVVPEGYELIKKIERILGVRLIKEEEVESYESPREERPKSLSFNPFSKEEVTIADLKKMKEKKEEKIFESSNNDELKLSDDPAYFNDDETPEYVPEEDLAENKEDKLLDKKDLSQGEMDDLIFGRK